MKPFEIKPDEIRAGDFILERYAKNWQKVRDPHWQGSCEIVEVALGDLVNRQNIVAAKRNYQPGDWRTV